MRTLKNGFWNVVGFLGRFERVVENTVLGVPNRTVPALAGHTVYGFQISHFSFRLRRAMRQMNLRLPQKDILESDTAYRELLGGGHRDQSPCLRIDRPDGTTEWMYGSKKIIAYLQRHVR